MKYMDIYYLYLIMDCQWRCAGSEANINPRWHYFVSLFVYFLEHSLLVSELHVSVQQSYEGRQKREGSWWLLQLDIPGTCSLPSSTPALDN